MRQGLLPRDIRGRLLLAVVLSVVLALAATISAFNLFLGRQLSREADDIARTRARAQLPALHVAKGRLVDSEAPDGASVSPLVWVFDSQGRTLDSPRVGPQVSQRARELVGTREHFVDSVSELRMFVLPVVSGNQRVGTVVTGVSLEPYDGTRRAALFASFGLAAALLVFVVLAARWALSRALQPVSRMTSEAAAWSENDLDRRFRLGDPHDEVTQLAATLDGLLDRLAASMRREKRVTAEISHELRTPLARISAEADLALRRERDAEDYQRTLEAIRRDADQLSRALETLVAAARQEGGPPHGTADAVGAAKAAIEACSILASDRNLDVALEAPPHATRVGVDSDVAQRILQPLIENACRYGRGRVRVSVGRNTDKIVFTVRDDGPGIESDERELIFEPGRRGSAAEHDGDGAGLGLALARRLARAVGGDVNAEASDSGGVFRASLPVG